MDGRHGKGRRLLISVVQFMKVFVQERHVESSVTPVGQIVLRNLKFEIF
jgi:hypothetical protein